MDNENIYKYVVFPIYEMANPILNKELEEYLSKRKRDSPIEITKEKEEVVIKKPFFAKIFSIFSRNKVEVEEEVIDVEFDEEEEKIKKLLKAMHKWLLRLPPDALREFKESEDYELYKEVLRSYGLIKE